MVEQEHYDRMKDWADHLMHENNEHRRRAVWAESRVRGLLPFAIAGWLLFFAMVAAKVWL